MNLSDRERRLLLILAAFIVVLGAAILLLRGGGDSALVEPFPSASPTAVVSETPASPTPTVFVVPPGTRDPFKA